MILAYFQSSRRLEVASKRHKFQGWSLRKGVFCVACHALAYKESLGHVLNYCSHTVILAYFQSARGLEVASKSPVLCTVSPVSV